MSNRIEINNLDECDRAFGRLGASVGPRTGVRKRSKDDKEWWVVRRFIQVAIRTGHIRTPLALEKRNPPDPDFILIDSPTTGVVGGIEVTEATVEEDQRERSAFERSGRRMMRVGDFGGRFPRGASQPGKAWAVDVIYAIQRKKGKAIFDAARTSRHLVVYPNSNASLLLAEKKDELNAIGYVQTELDNRRDGLVQITNGCSVHILGAYYVFLDILGQMGIAER